MLAHKGTVRLETERLVLRRFCLEDAEAMFRNWASDPIVTKYLTWPAHEDIDVTKRILEMWVEEYHNLNNYQWAVELRETGEPIGSIAVVKMDESNEHCEIGYCISRKHWGIGITTEALKIVIKFLFEEVMFNRIAATHQVENVASGRVMEKAGMQLEGRLNEYYKNLDGEYVDLNLHTILKKEYSENK